MGNLLPVFRGKSDGNLLPRCSASVYDLLCYFFPASYLPISKSLCSEKCFLFCMYRVLHMFPLRFTVLYLKLALIWCCKIPNVPLLLKKPYFSYFSISCKIPNLSLLLADLSRKWILSCKKPNLALSFRAYSYQILLHTVLHTAARYYCMYFLH